LLFPGWRLSATLEINVSLVAQQLIITNEKKEQNMNLDPDKKTMLTAAITPSGALINGALQWTVEPGGVQLFPVNGTMQCEALWASPGDVVVTATGNADLDPAGPVQPIRGTYAITCLPRPIIGTGITITAAPEVDAAA